jgi:Tfp pilus assembly protein FimT
MNKLNKNKGFSLLNLVLIIALIGTVGIFGFQIGMGYVNQSSIRSAVKSALLEAKSIENSSTTTVQNNIEKKLSVGIIDLTKDNFSVTKDGANFEVDVEYIKEIKVTDKIKIVVNYSFTEQTQ